MFLSTRLLCETQENLSPVRNVASLETLGTPPSVPDSSNNTVSPVTPTRQLLQSTPLSHLPHSVFPATDLNNLINAANLRQQQILTGKQPSSLTDSRQANRPSPLSPVSIVNIVTVNLMKTFLSEYSLVETCQHSAKPASFICTLKWTHRILVNFYQATQCHISEDCIVHGNCCENLRGHCLFSSHSMFMACLTQIMWHSVYCMHQHTNQQTARCRAKKLP
jgi:hypothetical protein